MPPLIDLTGQKFNRLYVIERNYSKSSRGAMWLCECECGKRIIVQSTHLRSGHTKSCGCLQKEKAALSMKAIQPKGSQAVTKDLANQQFGLLTAVEYSHSVKGSRIWKCQCECGNITYVSSHDLISHHTSSCGCLKRSKGEYIIEKLLKENNIIFIREKTFAGCVNKIKLRFDFFIQNNYLIEFDGRQHYESIKEWGGEEGLKQVQERDKIKNQFCQSNNIPLIRIPYNQINNLTIDDLLLETTKYRVV